MRMAGGGAEEKVWSKRETVADLLVVLVSSWVGGTDRRDARG